MSNKSAWYNDDVFVDIKTNNITCPLVGNNLLTKVIVQDSNNKFFWRDSNSIGGGAIGPTGATGPAGPSGATGATGPAGAGGVSGPLSSTNRALTLFNGTSGQVLMNSGITTDVTGQGLIFSNSALTDSSTQLDYYSLFDATYNFSSSGGGGVVISNLQVRLFRIGKMVLCEIGVGSGDQVNTGVLVSSGTIPATFMPDNQTTLYGLNAKSDSANIQGALNITAGGVLQLVPLSSAGSVISLGSFPGSGGVGTKINGTWQLSYFTWMIL